MGIMSLVILRPEFQPHFPGFSVNVVALQQTLPYFVCSDGFVNILLSNRCRNEGVVTSGDSSLSSGSRGAFAAFGGKFSSFFGGVLQPTRHIGSTSISSFDLFIFLPAFRIDIVLQSLLCVSCVFLCSDQVGLLFCDCFESSGLTKATAALLKLTVFRATATNVFELRVPILQCTC